MEKQRGATPHTRRRGMLTLEQLRVEVSEGNIDTVVVAFTDMQGRLQGKRLAAEFFLDDVVGGVIEGCNYLLAVDVEMNTVDGYAMSSWQTGYGDFVMVPDMGTLRRVPWHEATAMVIADLTWHDGTPVVASPRQILKAQTDRLAERGLQAMAGTELEFVVYNDSYAAAQAAGYRDLTPANSYNVDYSILGTARIEPLLRRLRNDMAGAGPPGRVGQGRVQPGPARDRVPVRRRRDDLRQPFDLQDRVQGDRRRGGHEHHVHGQAERRGKATPATSTCRSARTTGQPVMAGDGPHGLSRVRRALHRGPAGGAARAGAVARAEHQLLQAVRAGQFRPDRGPLGRGQPDLRDAAGRARRPALRVENRVPGGDVNPYLAVAAMIAAGLHGVDRELPLEEAFERERLHAEGARVPSTLRDALDLWLKSELAREAFGNDVVEHYANAARVEMAAFDAAVTDWELQRRAAVERIRAARRVRRRHVHVHRAEPGHRGDGGHRAVDARRSRPMRRSRGRPPRRPPGGRWPPATGPPCCAASPTWWTPTSRNSPGWRWPARATRSAQARWEAGNVRDVLRYYSAAPERLHRPADPGAGRPRRHVQGAGRHRRADRAVELPHADPGLGAGARPGRRESGDRQARGADPADRDPDRRAGPGGRPARTACSRCCRARARWWASGWWTTSSSARSSSPGPPRWAASSWRAAPGR